jgi:hypothetical protein
MLDVCNYPSSNLSSQAIESILTIDYSDNVGGIRTLSSNSEAGDYMTEETCINFCNGLGYIYAGVEYSDECCKSRLICLRVICHCTSTDTDGSFQTAATISIPDPLQQQQETVVWHAPIMLQSNVVVPTG